jgi:hypothetical protein
MPYDYACVLFAIFCISDGMKSYKIDQVNTMCLPFTIRTLSWKMSTWSTNNIKCFKCCHQHFWGHNYRDLSLGFATKARVCKGASREWNSGITLHVPRSVGECEGMNPHTPKWVPTLGTRVILDSQIFKERLQGSKLIELKKYIYTIENFLRLRCLKWVRMTHLGT